MKKLAVIYSGGKDSHLALLEAAAAGGRFSCLAGFDGGDRHEEYFNDARKPGLVAAHASLMGLPYGEIRTGPRFRIKDLRANVARLAAAASLFGADTLVSGVARCRCGGKISAWRSAARAAGFGLEAPVIGYDLVHAVRLCLEYGVRALITGTDYKKVDARWLGREMDAVFLDFITAEKRAGRSVDGSDLQTVVLDSPVFSGRIVPLRLAPASRGGQRLLRLEKFRVVRRRSPKIRLEKI